MTISEKQYLDYCGEDYLLCNKVYKVCFSYTFQLYDYLKNKATYCDHKLQYKKYYFICG